MFKLVILLFMVSAVLAEEEVLKTPVKPCEGLLDLPMPTVQVLVDGVVCTKLPCEVKGGKYVKTEMVFRPQEEVDTMTLKCNVTVAGNTIDYPLPNADHACDLVQNTFCPIEPGTNTLFAFKMKLMKGLPRVSADLEFFLQDQRKFTSSISNFEIVIPQRVNKDGNFISHVISHRHSKRSTKEMDVIFYKIPISGKEYLIELTPNKLLISPGAVIETHKIDLENLSQDLKNYTKEKVGKMLNDLNVRKLTDTECHFSGRIKGKNESKAALSTCYGLAGFIQMDKEFYNIEPVAEHNPLVEDEFPHIIYKSNSTHNNSVCQTLGTISTTLVDQMKRNRRESSIGISSPLYIEVLIVLDNSFIDYHKGFDCENYVLTAFNMASNIFNDASLGILMTLTVVRIIRLEVENEKMNLEVNKDAQKTLEYFQTWQNAINAGDDSHPNHHDVAVLITRVDVCNTPTSCGLLGLSTIGKACDPTFSAVLCEDSGLRLGYVVAHEIGHLLGAEHDMNDTLCNGTDPDGTKTVMHPQVSINSHTWSKCSQMDIKIFLKSGMGKCFLDEPEDHNFNVQDLLPGVMYNADFQCKYLITIDAEECELTSSCDSLNCYVPGYACIITHAPPADGTQCGENMWCHNGKCVEIGQRPGAVDGNWGEWSPWSECTRTCGSGVASSVRQCDKPSPSHGGKNCVGERKRYKICATTPCKTGRPSFRDVQCGEFNDWVYPEDGKVHTWKAYYQHEDNPCVLYCINEDKRVAAMKPRVVDGTMCYRGIRDICVAGTCKSLPCDLHFESNAIEDVCGICHGDGTSCEFSGGIETFTKPSKGVIKLINIPSGTKNIKVEEMYATPAQIVVKDKETKDIYVEGSNLGMYNVPGSQAWLGMIKKNQEALSIPGPVTKPLSIWIRDSGNASVKWSMALPPGQQRKPEFTWDFMKWGPCSAKCGPGTQKSEPGCMEEKAGLVESSFCFDLEMPPVKIRPCEVAKCIPRWMVGNWKGCEKPSSTEKVRKRMVYCIKPIGEGEGESQIVSDTECLSPKPHSTEPCENRQKREDTEYKHSFLENTMFRSDTVDFGIHRKYDDYLTHFTALSAPQRKSETIPLHLLSSPHFKHYFRVLETPEDFYNGGFQKENVDSNLSSFLFDHQNPNQVSPDFYKSTFSGNAIDVSHLQSPYISNKARKSVFRKEINFFENILEGIKSKKLNNLVRKRGNDRKVMKHSSKYRRSKKNSVSLNFLQNKSKRVIKSCPLQKTSSKNPQKLKVFEMKPKKNCFSKCSMFRKKLINERCRRMCFRKAQDSLSALFSRKKNTNFNYTSLNIEDLLYNYDPEKMDNKNELSYPPQNNYPDDTSQKKLIDCKFPNVNEISLNVPNDPFYFQNSFPTNGDDPQAQMNQKENNNYDENNEASPWIQIRKLYDGSGIRKFNFGKDYMPYRCFRNDYKSIEQRLKPHETASSQKNHFTTFFAPPIQNNFNYGEIKNQRRYNQIGNIAIEKGSKKLHPKTLNKRNVHLIVMERSPGEFAMFDCSKRHSNDDNISNKITKRLSHKWKKQKFKDSSAKNNKESTGSGCGTETRNYLNNLFRDTHPKLILKEDPKPLKEKTVINTGHLVVDKDDVNNQQIDVILPEENPEEFYRRDKIYPRPNQNQKLKLQGQDVFDLYQKIQQRNSRDFHKLKSDLEKGKKNDDEKEEIDVKIPGSNEKKSGKGSEPVNKNTTEKTLANENNKTTTTEKSTTTTTSASTTTSSATKTTTVKSSTKRLSLAGHISRFVEVFNNSQSNATKTPGTSRSKSQSSDATATPCCLNDTPPTSATIENESKASKANSKVTEADTTTESTEEPTEDPANACDDDNVSETTTEPSKKKGKKKSGKVKSGSKKLIDNTEEKPHESEKTKFLKQFLLGKIQDT